MKTTEALRAAIAALNQIPNTRLNGGEYRNTYALISALEKALAEVEVEPSATLASAAKDVLEYLTSRIVVLAGEEETKVSHLRFRLNEALDGLPKCGPCGDPAEMYVYNSGGEKAWLIVADINDADILEARAYQVSDGGTCEHDNPSAKLRTWPLEGSAGEQ